MTHVHLPLTPDWLLWPLPWAWLLLGLPLFLPLLWWLWLNPRRRPVLRFSSLATLTVVAGWRGRLWFALPVLRTIALGCLLVAAARPQRPNESRRTVVEGIAIQMVLDVSSSMLDTDLAPPGRQMTRLDVVKQVFAQFVNGVGDLPGRPNDLIGMIRFARYPDSVCPLTLDRDVLMQVLDDTHTVLWYDAGRLRGNKQEDGTAIGDGLALAVERLKDLRRTTGTGNQLIIHSRVIILLTDGENNAGIISPEQAGELAAKYGIRVYTILAGTGQRVNDFFGRRLPVDDSVLRQIAELTGGQFFHSTDQKSLEQIYAEIDRLERTKTEEHSYVEWGELAWPFLLVAFAALAVQTLLSATFLRKIP